MNVRGADIKPGGMRRPGPEGPSGDRDKKHIEVSLGKACNNRCIFCLNKGQRDFVPLEQVLEEGRKYAGEGYNSVGFIGGDPTIYPKVLELGRGFREMGFEYMHLITNGRKLAKLEFLDELIAAGFNRFSVSMHSHDAGVEDMLTGVEGGHAQKVQGVTNLVRRFREGAFRDRVAVNVVMNKLNVGELETTVRFLLGLGVDNIRLLVIRPEGTALDNFDLLVPRLTEVREALPGVIQAARRKRAHLRIDTLPFCLFYDIPGFTKIVADDYIDEVIADAVVSSRASFSWSKYRVRNKVKEESCGGCCFEGRCEGVWIGYVKKFGFGEFKPVTREDLCAL